MNEETTPESEVEEDKSLNLWAIHIVQRIDESGKEKPEVFIEGDPQTSEVVGLMEIIKSDIIAGMLDECDCEDED